MALPGSLAQRVYLLAHDPDKGKVGMFTEVGAMLRAAALADLYIGGHLTDERGRAVVHGRPTVGDPVLAGLLEEIAASRPRKWQYWIGKKQRPTVGAVRRQLGDEGWARLEAYKIVGLFPATKVTPRDPRVRKELVGRVKESLRAPVGRVGAADAALVTISAEAGLTIVLDRKTRRGNRRRLSELSVLTGPIGPALRKAIQAAHAESGG
ncbi:MAG TPA: GPP34 family phosphoprotein [Actinoplanes sp.]|nr:GPP34 family phosphoprotein [Actinoplanes sp.]